MRRFWTLLTTCLLLLLLAPLPFGCAARREPSAMSEAAMPSEEYGREAAPTSKSSSKDFLSRAPSGRSYQDVSSSSAGSVQAPPPQSAPAPAAPVARMVHYEGYARLRVSQLDEAVDRLTALSTSIGGKVELSTRSRVIVRVPVAQFREAFPQFLAFGDVMSRSVTAQDVSDSFFALELRLQTAEASRDHLVALLAKSTDEAEKLMLLREIQRLEEEIDRLHAQTATLSDLATMSRITLDLVARDAVVSRTSGQESLALAWIRGLSPFTDNAWQVGRRLLGVSVPEGMVQLDPKRYTAEAADGARIRGFRLPNEPMGDGDWWIDAMKARLSPDFAKADVRQVGEFTVVRFLDRSDTPYVYVIGARAVGNWLELVEVYYPTLTTEERHAGAVDAVLGGGAS